MGMPKFMRNLRGDWLVAILIMVACVVVALVWFDMKNGASGSIDTLVAYVALVVSLLSLGLSVHFWRKSFRPIVSAMVKTHCGGSDAIAYNLVLLNSGTIPAKQIRISADEASLTQALGLDATPENRKRWLACFEEEISIPVLHNGDRVSCSFGTTKSGDAGFWKYKSTVTVSIAYRGWFGSEYKERQELRILDSESFTRYSWGAFGTRA